ncbi:MAG: hypothetical protein Q7K57_28530, partial [Burkholderiaceae bacterium]|nr:hypothetical protein [Burkholderiaceae bacterium]
MTTSTQDAAASLIFSNILSRDGWSIPEVGACLKHFAVQTQASDETVCSTLLSWLDAVPQVGEHATGRRFTRLQFVENSLSAAGFALTLRDFSGWLASGAGGNWHPDDWLPYAPQDRRLIECEARVEQLEHELHRMEVAANRARAEVNFVVAERDHHLAVITQDIHQLVSQDYENSASWRLTKPLRRAMNWSRHMQATLRALLSRPPAATVAPGAMNSTNPSTPGTGEGPPLAKPKWASIAAPWDQPGYSTEAAWRVQAAADFDRHDYAEWVRRYDVASEADLRAMRQRAAAWAHPPLISVLMTVEQADAAWLAQAVGSVTAQIYPHWELCIAVAAQADPAIRAVLEHDAGLDKRIKLVFVPAAVPPAPTTLRAAALALALEAATGDWIVLLNAIDLIAIEAMFILANGINEHMDWRMVYSDADKLAGRNFERCQPNFKPDWDVDLFYAQNYTEHVCAFDARLVRQVGGFDARFEHAASFELTLRCLEQMQPGQIGHIPTILYHQRVIKEACEETGEETGSAGRAAPADVTAQSQAALHAHFARRGMAARAEQAEQGLRIRYALP